MKKTQIQENEEILKINKAKSENKKARKAQAIKTTRKVHFVSGKETKDIPKIQIDGIWLREYGFTVDSTFTITMEMNKLTLTKNA